jgi:hypothetical protein
MEVNKFIHVVGMTLGTEGKQMEQIVAPLDGMNNSMHTLHGIGTTGPAEAEQRSKT